MQRSKLRQAIFHRKGVIEEQQFFDQINLMQNELEFDEINNDVSRKCG